MTKRVRERILCLHRNRFSAMEIANQLKLPVEAVRAVIGKVDTI